MWTSDGRLRELQHPLAQHFLGLLRHRETRPADFRRHAEVLATLLAVEATRDLPLRAVVVPTPMETMACRELAARIVLVPVLRAGLGLLEPFSRLLPDAEIRHLGVYRDEATGRPVSYYQRVPAFNPPDVAFVLDPMLATGGSAVHAIETLQKWGVPNILLLTLIAAPEGLQDVLNRCSVVRILTAVIDRELNGQRYILPGLGDAGDRLFNTLE